MADIERTPEDILLFVRTLFSQVASQKHPKYKRKVFNCYVNTSLRVIQSSANPMKVRFLCMISMITLMRETEKSTISLSSQDDFNEMQKEVIVYLVKKEILKIRAVILDLCTDTYADDIAYSVKPEIWTKKIKEEIENVLPEPKNPTAAKLTAESLELLKNLLLQDLEEIFLGKAQPFGKKGNLLIVNILEIERYFAKRKQETKGFSGLIEKIQMNFKKKEDIESIEHLRDLQLQK